MNIIEENILGDCLDVMPTLKNRKLKFNLILADLPYEMTKNSWDTIIPFDVLWKNYMDLTYDNTAIVLFAQGKFTAKLILSNEKMWKYNLVWNKILTSGFLNSKRQPLRSHEDICVFYSKQPTYNPQMILGDKNHAQGNRKEPENNNNYGNFKYIEKKDGLKYPKSILTFSRYASSKMIHPTQKPIDLLRYLIRTYTNQGDVILDNTAGVLSTSIAAKLERRNFVCIEKSKNYYELGINLYESYNYKNNFF